MSLLFVPPHWSSKVDQDLSTHGSPHHSGHTIGDRSQFEPGSGLFKIVKYDGEVRTETRFIPTASGGLSIRLWAEDTGLELPFVTVEVAGAIYDLPQTFSASTVFNALSTFGANVVYGAEETNFTITCHHLPTFTKKVVLSADLPDALDISTGGGKMGYLHIAGRSASSPAPGLTGLVWFDTTDRLRRGDAGLVAQFPSVPDPAPTAGSVVVSNGTAGEMVYDPSITIADGTISGISDLNLTGAVTSGSLTTGTGTFSAGLSVENGHLGGKTIYGGVWYRLYQIEAGKNEMINFTCLTKDTDSSVVASKTVSIGSKPSVAVISYEYSLDGGSTANQARVCAFENTDPVPTDEVSQLLGGRTVNRSDYSGQSFTAVTGKKLYSIQFRLVAGGSASSVHCCLCPGTGYNPATIIATSSSVGYLGHGWYEYVFPTTPAMTSGTLYFAVLIPEQEGTYIRFAYATGNPYKQGRVGHYALPAGPMTWDGTSDYTFIVRTLATSSVDIYIYPTADAASRTDVKVFGCSTDPIWAEDGVGEWPDSRPAGVGLTFDTSDPITYPPTMTKSFGSLSLTSDLLLRGGSMASWITTPEMYGAVGDGVPAGVAPTDNAVALASLLTNTYVSGTGYPKIRGPPKRYYTSALSAPLGLPVDNKSGVQILVPDPDHPLLPRLYNSGARDQIVFGLENLNGFHQKIMAGKHVTICLVGDSATEYNLRTDFPYSRGGALGFLAALDGFDVTIVNHGHSGKTSVDWYNTYLAEDIAVAADLYICIYGLNNQYLSGSADMEVGRTSHITYNRLCLTELRTTYPISSGVGIIVAVPSSANCYANASKYLTELYLESLIEPTKQMAIDFDAAYLNIYYFLQNSRTSPNNSEGWFDNWNSGEGHLHPKNAYQGLTAQMLYDMCFPPIHRRYRNAIPRDQVTGSLSVTQPSLAAPFYVSGTSIYADRNGYFSAPAYNPASTDARPTIVNGRIGCPADFGLIWWPDLTSDGGQVGCLRVKFTPTYTGYPSGTAPIFNMGFLVSDSIGNTNSNRNKISYYQTSAGSFVLLLYDSDATQLVFNTSGARSMVAGQEYTFEIDWDFTGGQTTRIFLDGLQIYSGSIDAPRGQTPHLKVGGGADLGYYRQIERFPTVQHTSDHAVTTYPTSLLSAEGLTIQSSTASSSTTTGCAVLAGGIGVGGNANVGGTVASASLSVSGSGTVGGEIGSASTSVTTGVVKGSILPGGTWYRVYQLESVRNDRCTIEFRTKNVNSAIPGMVTLNGGVIPGDPAPSFRYSVDGGPSTNRPRIVAFDSTSTGVTTLIDQSVNNGFANNVTTYGGQSFTMTKNSALSSIRVQMSSATAGNSYMVLCPASGYNAGSIIATSDSIAISGAGWKEYPFSTAPHLTNTTQYSFFAIHETVGATIGLYHNTTGPYAGGRRGTWDTVLSRMTWVDGTDLTFQVKVTGYVSSDIYVYGLADAGSSTDVKILSSAIVPIQVAEGDGLWPASHISGTGVLLDTSDPSTFPPSIAKEFGTISSDGGVTSTNGGGAQMTLNYERAAEHTSTFTTGADGNLTINPSGGTVIITGGIHTHPISSSIAEVSTRRTLVHTQTIDAATSTLTTLTTVNGHKYMIELNISFGTPDASGLGMAKIFYGCSNPGAGAANTSLVVVGQDNNMTLVGSPFAIDVGAGPTVNDSFVTVTGKLGLTINWSAEVTVIDSV